MSSCEHTQSGLSDDFNYSGVLKALPLVEYCRWREDFRDWYMANKKIHKGFNNYHSSDVCNFFIEYIETFYDLKDNKDYKHIIKPLLITTAMSEMVEDYIRYKYTKRYSYLLEYYPEALIKI